MKSPRLVERIDLCLQLLALLGFLLDEILAPFKSDERVRVILSRCEYRTR
jgi:hypothetical protein